MTPDPTALTAPPRTLWSKVPEITLLFWIVKIFCTTIGETAADFLNMHLRVGLSRTTLIMGALLLVSLAAQYRARRYVPAVYWLTVMLISVVGTLITDNLTDHFGVSLWTSAAVFAAALAATFILWYRSEGTLSIHSVVTARRETFYWLAALLTFALGTATGDLLAEQLQLGYLPSALIFGGLIALTAGAHYALRVSGVLTFWLAYVLTRPLGASLGDELSQGRSDGGLGLGTTATSLLFLAGSVAIVAYLTLTRRDQIRVTDFGDTGRG